MDENDIEKRDRINRIIETEGMSQRAFADKVGVNSTNLNQVILGKRSVPKTLPGKIINAFPEVRIDWLLYGEGEMYKKEQLLADNQAIKEHIAQLPTKPRLPKNADGNVEEYYKGDKRRECTERPIIYNLSDYDFSMLLKSNRMTPKFEPGDELFFKETDCLKAGGSEPEWGDEFLLDTKNGLRFKRIYPAVNEAGEKCIRCVSYNKEEYPDFLVSIKSIRAVYRYIGALRIK